MKRFNVSLSDPQAEKLVEQAKKRGISLAEYLRRIVDEFLENQDQEKSR
jgi:hypothetical protein